ncbi:hypothetical protein AAE478_005841 [Parahypoxylon ruwenzoriense]
MPTIAVTGASGKLGGATLAALLEYSLVPASDIAALTSSTPGTATWDGLQAKGVQVRHASFDDLASFEQALRGVERFFLVSTPRVELDFEREGGGEPADGEGREAHHRCAIDAAVRAGVKHVYYSSLAFGWGTDGQGGAPGSKSEAGVMRAHLRTERYLARLEGKIDVTVAREGLYSESWPLYLGYFDPKADDRSVVRPAGDGRICWTAIRDLGIANALLLTAPPGEYSGRTVYLATRPGRARCLREVAELVGREKGRGRKVEVEIVGAREHERYYVEERGMDRRAVRWWASTYRALEEGECLVDDPTLERLLEGLGVKVTEFEEVVGRMVRGMMWKKNTFRYLARILQDEVPVVLSYYHERSSSHRFKYSDITS